MKTQNCMRNFGIASMSNRLIVDLEKRRLNTMENIKDVYNNSILKNFYRDNILSVRNIRNKIREKFPKLFDIGTMS